MKETRNLGVRTNSNQSIHPIPTAMEDFPDSALHRWDIPAGATTKLINVAENRTYLVEDGGGFRSVLRVHRAGYHSRREILSELDWLRALAESGTVDVPAIIAGRDGDEVQTVDVSGNRESRNLVMFAFVDGTHPDERGELSDDFRNLGRIAARTHVHSRQWRRPDGFLRPAWDINAVFGPQPRWGNWRNAPNVTPDILAVLERAETLLRRRLGSFGTGPERFGLIHADMRLANLIAGEGRIWLIDFDDCGFGWFLYDFATAISFIEDHPQVPKLREAWIGGYTEFLPLSLDEVREMDSFVMLRRMALLAWIGSRIESTEPQQLAGDFARGTSILAERYLSGHA